MTEEKIKNEVIPCIIQMMKNFDTADIGVLFPRKFRLGSTYFLLLRAQTSNLENVKDPSGKDDEYTLSNLSNDIFKIVNRLGLYLNNCTCTMIHIMYASSYMIHMSI